MGIHLIGWESAAVAPSSVAALTEDASRPASSTLTPTRPNRIFAGTGSWASETLVYDFGATTTLEGALVDNHNILEGVTIEGNATDEWDSPSYAADFNEVAARVWGRQRTFVDLTGSTWASAGYRYMRIKPFGTGTDDGSSVWKVGGVSLYSTLAATSENMGFPVGLALNEATKIDPRPDGSDEIAILGPQFFSLSLNQDSGTTDLEPFAQQVIAQGTGRYFTFFRNNGNLREAYLVRRAQPAELRELGVNIRGLQGLVLKEAS